MGVRPPLHSGGRVLELERMSWVEVADLNLDRTVVFLLSGPVEQHGPHLPLGSDLMQARLVMEEIARRVAAQGWTALLAPALPYTTAVLSRRYPGSVSIRRKHIVPFFVDLLNSFANNGLRNIVVVSQHIDPPHVTAWEDACTRAGEESGARAIEGYERMVFDDLKEDRLSGLLGELSGFDSHAGMFETSVVMLAEPELVRVASETEPMRLEFRELRNAKDFRELGNGMGYTGDPASATPEIGRALVERYARSYGDVVLEHLGGGEVWDRLTIRHLFPSKADAQ